jgi:hypothetical protein
VEGGHAGFEYHKQIYGRRDGDDPADSYIADAPAFDDQRQEIAHGIGHHRR